MDELSDKDKLGIWEAVTRGADHMRRQRAFYMKGSGSLGGAGDATAPIPTISIVSAAGAIASMQIVFSEAVQNFVVGDITISGGSLASFATADNITFTVDWTLAAGVNTMDVGAGVCTDLANNANTAASQYALTLISLQPDSTTGTDTYLQVSAPDTASTDVITIRDQLTNTNALIKFPISLDPNPVILSGTLSLWMALQVAGAGTHTVRRILAANSGWVEAATWNFADGAGASIRWAGDAAANGGADAGCSVAGTDFSSTVLGTSADAGNEVAGTQHDFTLNTTELALMCTNNYGMVLTSDVANVKRWHSCEGATAGLRPKLVMVVRYP
jgi:hypothetical protein